MKKLYLIAIIIAIIAIASYLLLSRPTTTTPATEPAAFTDTSLLSGLAKDLGLSAELRDYIYMDWLNEKDIPLPLNGKQFIVGTVNINGIGKYPEIGENDLSAITIKNLSPLLTATDAYFTRNGFTKNERNTRIVGTAPITTAFYGYEKDGTKCVVRIDEQTDPFGNFVCGVVDLQQEKLQQAFVPLFIGSKRDGDEITSLRVQKIEGDYAMGSANGVISGYTWMAKKTDGKWEVVWTGQEIPLCTEMEKYTIPISIYENCYNEPA